MYISGICFAYLWHIFCISRAYLLHISGISWVYLGHIFDISCAYLGHIFCISEAYLGHILGILQCSIVFNNVVSLVQFSITNYQKFDTFIFWNLQNFYYFAVLFSIFIYIPVFFVLFSWLDGMIQTTFITRAPSLLIIRNFTAVPASFKGILSWGKMPVGQNAHGAKCPLGKMPLGQNVFGAKYLLANHDNDNDEK